MNILKDCYIVSCGMIKCILRECHKMPLRNVTMYPSEMIQCAAIISRENIRSEPTSARCFRLHPIHWAQKGSPNSGCSIATAPGPAGWKRPRLPASFPGRAGSSPPPPLEPPNPQELREKQKRLSSDPWRPAPPGSFRVGLLCFGLLCLLLTV